VPISVVTTRIRLVISDESRRSPEGATPSARCVRANASRSAMVVIGVAPQADQDSGSMNISVRRRAIVCGSKK
jgi:hypothetical protein